MRGAEREKFIGELSAFLAWYAKAVRRHIQGFAERIDLHPNEFFETVHSNCGAFEVGVDLQNDEIYAQIRADYTKLLRGKSLLGLLMRQLSYAGRPVKHNHRALFELVGNSPGPILRSLFNTINARFCPELVGGDA